MKTGGPRLDAPENSTAETGADSSAGTVQTGDKIETIIGWKLAGASTCPLATAHIEHDPCEDGASAWNCEWACASAANIPTRNNRKAISPASAGRGQPVFRCLGCGMFRISAGVMPFDKAFAGGAPLRTA